MNDSTTGLSLFEDGGYSHPNPMFDFLSGYVPRKLKDLFRWTEYLYYSSPHIFQALVKLSDYILTDVVIKTDSDTDRKRYEELFKTISLLPTLRACARDRMIYGNSFVSLYYPFTRWTTCPHCKGKMVLREADYEFELETLTAHVTCRYADCGLDYDEIITEMEVEKSRDYSKINIIRWDPKLIDIDYNPITGYSAYYFTLEESFRDAIKNGNKPYVETAPNEVLVNLSREDELFQFDDDQIFHMKVPSPAGIDPSWGYPPITSVIKQFLYAQVLRKANEAIALDYLVPLRILHPAQTSGTNDPFEKLSLEIWREEMETSIRMQRRDPLHMMFAPVAVGVTQVGGQGRTLLTLGEVEAAENNIMAGLGLPREFLHGGLSYTGSSVTLRMIENQLRTHSADIHDLLRWIAQHIARELQWPEVETELTSFRFIDDVHQKNLLLQLNAQYNGQLISKRTICELFNLNIDDEEKQLEQETLDTERRNQELQQKLEELNNTLAQQASAEAQGMGGLNYDQHAVIAQADQLTQQLMQLDQGTRRSHLDALSKEDQVMYAVVRQRMEQMQVSQEAEARAMVRQGG